MAVQLTITPDNLAKLESLCGEACPETQRLAQTIAQGTKQRVLTAEMVLPDTEVVQSN